MTKLEGNLIFVPLKLIKIEKFYSIECFYIKLFQMQTIVSQLYDIKWYNYDKTANQCVQFMIFRSQKFPYLSGMKIIRSNLESLKNVSPVKY